MSFTSAAVALWATGAGLVLLWVLYGVLATSRMRRRGARPTTGWGDEAGAIAAEIGLGRVRFVESPDASVPFVCGIVRPLVVMPAQVSEWASERLRAVLLHELAHVSRRDCLTQLLARVACAIYWFHPLVWLAAHRLRIERERACDDVVLTSGVLGSVYGHHLVEIARSAASRRPHFAAGGVAMAHPRRLEERLMFILDPRIPRKSPLSSRLVVTAFGLAALALASLQTKAQASAAQPPAASATHARAASAAQAPAAAAPVPVARVAATERPPAAQPLAAQARAAAGTPQNVTIEVASIKRNMQVEQQRLAIPSNIPTVPGRAQTLSGGVLMGRGMTVMELIRDAYGYRNRAKGDIMGGPEWINTERYDVQARANGEFPLSTSTGLPPAGEAALRALLAERLNLQVRIESPLRPVYELIVLRADGQLGPDLKPSEGGCIPFFQREAVNAGLVLEKPQPLRPCPLLIAPGIMAAENMTMAEWAQLLTLAPQLDRTVVDRTYLTGRYDFKLGGDEPASAVAARDRLPAMTPALERRLGLTLHEGQAPVEILVIEHVDRPSEN
jgi:uncharacterized protein (TIGR03435 family)